MKSTLIELPPESGGLDEESIEFVEAKSVDEIAQQGHIDDERVLKRLLLPGQAFGPYKILGFIAAGGMGEVYAAERIMSDGRRLGPVALKVISPEYMDDWAIAERFKREAQISRAIRSPHVTRVYEFGETEAGHAFLAMEMLHGEELFDRMYVDGGFEPNEVAEIMLELLAGLRAVHESGFIHRDIKPENIYFCRREGAAEIVKILDFGIAKRSDQKSDPYLSVVGKVYGTPEYIAPEQGLNPDVDARADLYSAGIIMYELLAGHLPYQGETAYALILSHQNEPVPPLPGYVPEDLAKIVMKSLEKKAENRFQSAEEFQRAIRSWFDGRREDDLLDTGNLMADRVRTNTPNHPQQTPLAGVPRAEPGTPPPTAEASAEFDATPAPPVQIFSKSNKLSTQERQALARERPPAPGEPASASQDELPLSARPQAANEGSSTMATVITAAVVAMIIAAVIYALL